MSTVRDRIDLDDEGAPDDVFIRDVYTVHIERMDTFRLYVHKALRLGHVMALRILDAAQQAAELAPGEGRMTKGDE